MGDTDWSTDLVKLGYEARNKFDFYVVALSFTLLGLAVQTAPSTPPPAVAVFELLGWLGLLAAGLSGLHRLELQPRVFELLGLQAGQQSRLAGMRRARAEGVAEVHLLDSATDRPVADQIAHDERDMEKIEGAYQETSGKSLRSYKRRSFFLLQGIGSLMLSRGWELVAAILTLFGVDAAA